MPNPIAALLTYLSLMFASTAYADYTQGCDDPDYLNYIEEQFAESTARNRRLFSQTLRDYKLSLSTNNNLYEVIASLSRHLRYSAQFEPPHEVRLKIDRIFEHADELTVAQQIAGDLLDNWSSETHSVGIARAWIAYRQGKHAIAFEELLKSIEVSDSAILSAYGPDFGLIRQIYRDGHISPVVTYINKTEDFWTGKRPDELRNVWLKMIDAGCKIQFDSVDTIKAVDLGLINKGYPD